MKHDLIIVFWAEHFKLPFGQTYVTFGDLLANILYILIQIDRPNCHLQIWHKIQIYYTATTVFSDGTFSSCHPCQSSYSEVYKNTFHCFCDGSISLFICAVFKPEPLIVLHIKERADTHSDHQQANVSTCWLMKGYNHYKRFLLDTLM